MNKHIKQNNNIFNEGKILPQCIEIEMDLLSTLLSIEKSVNIISNIIKEEHFYKDEHKIIYNTIIELYKNDIIPDVIIVTQKLRDKNKLEEVGGAGYISKLSRLKLSDSNLMFNAFLIIEKYVLREIISHSSNNIKKAYDNENPFDIITHTNEHYTKIVDDCRALEQKDLKNNISNTIQNIIDIHSNNELLKKQWYNFNIEQIDKYALISPNNTLLVGGKSGSGKTRFIIFLIRELLKHHSEEISVKWYSMEDDAAKLVRCFLSAYIGLSDEQMEGKNYKMTEADIYKLIDYKTMFEKYDVSIVEKPRSMAEIALEYKAFVSSRMDKFNILIIDNLMLLNDNAQNINQLKIDDNIARELYSIRNTCHTNNINSYTIALHHFTDEQLDSANIKTAYRPREKHFKGSTRLRDASTQIILLNRFSNYPDLLEIYPDMKKELEKLISIDITKNRNGSVGLERAFAVMPYSDFHLI